MVASAQADAIERFVGPIKDRTILDVGTGTGRAAILMARGGARVTAVDPSEEMLAIARQAGGRGIARDSVSAAAMRTGSSSPIGRSTSSSACAC